MSGLDIAGLVFSILGIAETGAQLSLKLCNVYRRIKNADRSIESLSSDVGLTCNVLRQLGDNLSHDEHAKLYSAQALSTAQDILRECKAVFDKISKALDESDSSSAKNMFQRVRKRVGFVMVEEELHVLGSNLERLKSTMLLLLNVIMYAGQVRSRAELGTLEEQRRLIQTLVEEKKQNDERFEALTKALGTCSITNLITISDSWSEDTLSVELRAYYRLVESVLSEIDMHQSALEQARYQRVRNGFLEIHSKEVSHIRVSHGNVAADAIKGRVANRSNERIEPSCAQLSPRLTGSSTGDTAPIISSRDRDVSSRIEIPRERHSFNSPDHTPDSGGLVWSCVDYGLKDSPPPFDNIDGDKSSPDEAEPSRKRLRMSRKAPIFGGSRQLITHLEPNRPDLAMVENEDSPQHECQGLKPCITVNGESHSPDPQSPRHDVLFLPEEEPNSLFPSSRKRVTSGSTVSPETKDMSRGPAKEQVMPSPSAEQHGLERDQQHAPLSDSLPLPSLAPRQERNLSNPDSRLSRLLIRHSSPAIRLPEIHWPVTTNPGLKPLPSLQSTLTEITDVPGHPGAYSDRDSEAPAPSLDYLKPELLFCPSALLDIKVLVQAWTTLRRDELNL